MELVGNAVNKKFLWNVLPSEGDIEDIDYVLAAIAYGSEIINPKGGLVDHCVENKLRLDLWMRYDHTVPVSIPMLNKLLGSTRYNVFTKFIPDKLHTKLIWWKGYGAYVGSANHTESAWNNNLELGVFFTDDDLVKNGFDQQFDEYFDYLRNLEVAISLDQSYIDEMEQLEKHRDKSKAAEKARRTKKWGGPTFVNSEKPRDRRKAEFNREWHSTLGTLKDIEDRLDDYRPEWINKDIPLGWQVDQFLHSYYYKRLGDGHRKPYEQQHQLNIKDPNGALKTELDWWSSLKTAPWHEDKMLYESAPIIQRLLVKEKVLNLTNDEFAQLCELTHSTKNHLMKVSTEELGRSDISSLSLQERLPLFATLILSKKNVKGWDVRELLNYVLYGGADTDMWERIYHAGRDPSYSIPRYGLNSIAEVCGWARPEVAPPRNGRTSKALRALGFDVRIY